VSEWRNTKAQREALRAMFDGRCAYCGCDLGKAMHADHVEPVGHKTHDAWSQPLPPEERGFYKPERNTVSNMMPACAPCNLHKGGYSLEGWRAYLARSAEIVRKQTSTFRAGERCGVPKDRAYAVDAFPTTRNDLRVHYTAIEEGTVPRPKWAQEQPS
jgi:hypothetical protein